MNTLTTEQLIGRAAEFGLTLNEPIAGMIERRAAVGLGISGGKDSVAMTIRTIKFLRSINYKGDIICVHSDLGSIEHESSLAECRKLTEFLGVELAVVKPANPLLERFEQRWEGIRERFANLERVKVISPFSSSSMKFCTGESKTQPITRFLRNRFAGQEIINAVGLRREESTTRAKRPVSAPNKLLKSTALKTTGSDWFPVIDLLIEDVWLTHREHNFAPHEAYTKLGMSRVSCSFCVLSNINDLTQSMTEPKNHQTFHRLANLEIKSGFSFQSGRFLSELGGHLLSERQTNDLKVAKEIAARRMLLEKALPDELLLTDGFPSFQPSMEQSEVMAEFRRGIAGLLGINALYLTAGEVFDRYAELTAVREAKEAEAARKAAGRLAKTGAAVKGFLDRSAEPKNDLAGYAVLPPPPVTGQMSLFA